MRRDSNSREPCDPTRFPGVRLKPLGHPSNYGLFMLRGKKIARGRLPSQRAGRRMLRAGAFRSGTAMCGPRAYGQGEIRTHDTLAGTPVFETGAFNHSATYPQSRILAKASPSDNGRAAMQKLEALRRENLYHPSAPRGSHRRHLQHARHLISPALLRKKLPQQCRTRRRLHPAQHFR
jgi:hypothetical protein